MYALCLTLAALIFSATGRFDPYLTRVSDASAIHAEPTAAAYLGTQQATVCRWLWALSGLELC